MKPEYVLYGTRRRVFYILFLVCFTGSWNTLPAQERVSVSGGFGIPEYFNLGFTRGSDRNAFGVSAGFLPYNGLFLSAAGDYYYHPGGIFEIAGKYPWYGRLGFVYNYEESYYNIWHDVYFNPRIGREINFTGKFGMSVDAGVAVNVFHRRIVKVEPPWALLNLDVHFTVLPGVGMRLFYRIM